jgi:hypothetical protein
VDRTLECSLAGGFRVLLGRTGARFERAIARARHTPGLKPQAYATGAAVTGYSYAGEERTSIVAWEGDKDCPRVGMAPGADSVPHRAVVFQPCDCSASARSLCMATSAVWAFGRHWRGRFCAFYRVCRPGREAACYEPSPLDSRRPPDSERYGYPSLFCSAPAPAPHLSAMRHCGRRRLQFLPPLQL